MNYTLEADFHDKFNINYQILTAHYLSNHLLILYDADPGFPLSGLFK